MEIMLPTVCQRCAGAMPVRYRWLGAPADCPHCLGTTVPVMKPGKSYPPTGYELSFHDFVELLRSRDRGVKEFLARWYGYSLDASVDSPRVVNGQAEAIDFAWLHERIQEDVPRRQEIHDIAMSLWR